MPPHAIRFVALAVAAVLRLTRSEAPVLELVSWTVDTLAPSWDPDPAGRGFPPDFAGGTGP